MGTKQVQVLWADASFTRPTVAQLKAADRTGIIGYVSPDPRKNVTKAECDAYRAAGIAVALVWESTANRAADGMAAGVADATEANRQADALGYPSDCVIFYAVDFNAVTGFVVGSYFKGAKSRLGMRPVGLYGGIALTGLQLASYNWQTSAWSHGLVDGSANLYQRQKATHPLAGTGEDVLLNDFPYWGAAPVHVARSYPNIAAALRSNKVHADDLRKVKAQRASVAVHASLLALKIERGRLAAIVRKGK